MISADGTRIFTVIEDIPGDWDGKEAYARYPVVFDEKGNLIRRLAMFDKPVSNYYITDNGRYGCFYCSATFIITPPPDKKSISCEVETLKHFTAFYEVGGDTLPMGEFIGTPRITEQGMATVSKDGKIVFSHDFSKR